MLKKSRYKYYIAKVKKYAKTNMINEAIEDTKHQVQIFSIIKT